MRRIRYVCNTGNLSVGRAAALCYFFIHDIEYQKPGFQNDMADYDYYTSVFGPLDKLEESRNNPEYLEKGILWALEDNR